MRRLHISAIQRYRRLIGGLKFSLTHLANSLKTMIYSETLVFI